MIIGFTYCGKSILKSIIGRIEDVEEIFLETDKIKNYPKNMYYVKHEFFEKSTKTILKYFIKFKNNI